MSICRTFGTKAQDTRAILFNTRFACPCRISSQFRGEKGESGDMPNGLFFITYFFCPRMGKFIHFNHLVRLSSDFPSFPLSNKQIVFRGPKGACTFYNIVVKRRSFNHMRLHLTLFSTLSLAPLRLPNSLSYSHIYHLQTLTNIINIKPTSHFEKARSIYARPLKVKLHNSQPHCFCIAFSSRLTPKLNARTVSSFCICYFYRFRLSPCVAQSYYIYLQIVFYLLKSNQPNQEVIE